MSGRIDGNYRGWEQLQRAVRDRADRRDPETIRRFLHDRLLCRIFDGGDGWVLKGGTSMLAKHQDARSTRDIDLHRAGDSIEDAVRELEELAGADLGDHLRFRLKDAKPTAETSTQPGRQAVKVRFDVLGSGKPAGVVKLDVVVGAPPRSAPRVLVPATRVEVPGLPTVDYVLTPVTDAIADKVCATLSSSYASGTSSRERDLVDLVIYAKTEQPNSIELGRALSDEMRSRGLTAEAFTVPEAWGVGYAKLAATVPHCAEHADVASAQRLVAAFIDPILADQQSPSTWDGQRWVETSARPEESPYRVDLGAQPRRPAGSPAGGQYDRKRAPRASAELG